MLFFLFSLPYHLASCEFMLLCHSVYYFIGCPLISLYFFCTNRLGRDADEAKAKEFNEMACKASIADQQKQVQENIHPQIKSFYMCINEVLLLYTRRIGKAQELLPQPIDAPCQSGLGFNIGQPTDYLGKILFVKKKKTFPMLHYMSLKLCECNLRCSGSLNFSCDSSLK